MPAAVARFPPELLTTKVRRIAVCDFLTRSFGAAVSASGERAWYWLVGEAGRRG